MPRSIAEPRGWRCLAAELAYDLSGNPPGRAAGGETGTPAGDRRNPRPSGRRGVNGTNQGRDVRPEVPALLRSVSPPRVREAAARLDAAELVMMARDDERAQLRYAAALSEWGEAGGDPAEGHWGAC